MTCSIIPTIIMSVDITIILLMIGIGILASTYGSLVGAGGGFIVMPILILISPESPPSLLTAISLTGVLMAGLSGAWAYHRLGLIDYRSAIAFAIPRIPGAILGVFIVHQISPSLFRIVLGVVLILAGATLLRRPVQNAIASTRKGLSYRYIQDRQGDVYEYRFNLPLGMAANFPVGTLSSLLGVGGGLIFTPFAITVLGFPTLIATATSVFTLVFTTLAALVTHVTTGTFSDGDLRLLPVALGMAVGGQIGPRIARRVGDKFVRRLLASTLMGIGASMAVSQFL